MKYNLRACNNGWILFVNADPIVDGPYGEFIYASLKEVFEHIAKIHGEPL